MGFCHTDKMCPGGGVGGAPPRGEVWGEHRNWSFTVESSPRATLINSDVLFNENLTSYFEERSYSRRVMDIYQLEWYQLDI